MPDSPPRCPQPQPNSRANLSTGSVDNPVHNSGRGAIPLQIRSLSRFGQNLGKMRKPCKRYAFRVIKSKFMESLTESTRFCDGHSGVEKSSRARHNQSRIGYSTPRTSGVRQARCCPPSMAMSCPVSPGASRMKPSAAAISAGEAPRPRTVAARWSAKCRARLPHPAQRRSRPDGVDPHVRRQRPAPPSGSAPRAPSWQSYKLQTPGSASAPAGRSC